jgi:hypothetical protein
MTALQRPARAACGFFSWTIQVDLRNGQRPSYRIAETGAERIAHLSVSRQPTGLCQKQSHVLFCLDSLWVKSQNYSDRNAIPER